MRELRDEEQYVSERDEEGEAACYRVKSIFIYRVRGFNFFFFFNIIYVYGSGLYRVCIIPIPDPNPF